MSSFKEYLQSQGKSKSTVEHYQRYILDFITWLDQDNTEVENATAKEVMGYLNHLQKKGISNTTKSYRLNTINQFFDYQIEQELRKEHPSRHIKIRGSNVKKLTPILTRSELEKIYLEYQIPSAEDPRKNRNWFTTYRLAKQRNKIILSLLINQGLTTAEINRLEIKDLQLRSGDILIKGSRKSEERTLKLKSNQIMDLMEYQFTTRSELLSYQTNKEVENLFLPVPVAGKQTAAQSLDIWKGLAKGIKEEHTNFINLRQVRTSVITNWLKHHNLREVQYMAGHRYVSTTEGYRLNQVDDLLKDIDQYHPLN